VLLSIGCLKNIRRSGRKSLSTPFHKVVVLTLPRQHNAHSHLHCLITAGVKEQNAKGWLPCPGTYLFKQRALSLVFHAELMQLLSCARQRGALVFQTDWYGSKRSAIASARTRKYWTPKKKLRSSAIHMHSQMIAVDERIPGGMWGTATIRLSRMKPGIGSYFPDKFS
jgi:hypothetical protein